MILRRDRDLGSMLCAVLILIFFIIILKGMKIRAMGNLRDGLVNVSPCAGVCTKIAA